MTRFGIPVKRSEYNTRTGCVFSSQSRVHENYKIFIARFDFHGEGKSFKKSIPSVSFNKLTS